MPMSSSFETRSQVPSSNLWRSPPLTVVTFNNSPALLSARTFEHSLNILNKCSNTGINSANADQRGFGKLVFRQDIRVPPYQCPQTGSPFAHHCILSSRSMSEYGLFRSRGFCAFFFLGIGMKPRLISRFRSLLCLADLAILQPSLIVFWKEPAPLFAAMSSDAPFGYSRPGGRGAGSRQFNPFRCRCFSGDRHYRLILRAFCG
jgi:hypothetical protein